MDFSFEKPMNLKKLIYVEPDEVTSIIICDATDIDAQMLFARCLPVGMSKIQAEDIAQRVRELSLDAAVEVDSESYLEWREREDVGKIRFRDGEGNILQIEDDLYYENNDHPLSEPIQTFLDNEGYKGDNEWKWA